MSVTVFTVIKMEIRVLRYFLTVAAEGSISAAAAALHMTQPTLSRQIMQLEEELGVQLIKRGKRNRRISLTAEGQLLRSRAQELVQLAEKTKAEFKLVENDIGEVFLAAGETDAMRYVARAAERMRASYPNLTVHLHSGNSDFVMDQLEKGLCDFGLLLGMTDEEKYNSLLLPVSDEWGVLTRCDSHLCSLDAVRPLDLLGVPLMVSQQAASSRELSAWLGDIGERLKIVGSYNLILNASKFVAEGYGSALCLKNLVPPSRELRFIPFSPGLKANIYIVWKKYQMLSPAASRFFDCFLQELSSL